MPSVEERFAGAVKHAAHFRLRKGASYAVTLPDRQGNRRMYRFYSSRSVAVELPEHISKFRQMDVLIEVAPNGAPVRIPGVDDAGPGEMLVGQRMAEPRSFRTMRANEDVPPILNDVRSEQQARSAVAGTSGRVMPRSEPEVAGRQVHPSGQHRDVRPAAERAPREAAVVKGDRAGQRIADAERSAHRATERAARRAGAAERARPAEKYLCPKCGEARFAKLASLTAHVVSQCPANRPGGAGG